MPLEWKPLGFTEEIVVVYRDAATETHRSFFDEIAEMTLVRFTDCNKAQM